MRVRSGDRYRTARVPLLWGALLLSSCSGGEFSSSQDDASCSSASCAGEASGGNTDSGGSVGHAGKSNGGGGSKPSDGASSSAGSDATDGGQMSTGGAEPQAGTSGGGGVAGVGGVTIIGGGGGMPSPAEFPQTKLLDDFNRTGPAVGSAWMGETAEFSLKEQALFCENCGRSLFWSEPFGEQQEVFATLRGFDGAAMEINLLLKGQGSTSCDQIEVIYAPEALALRVAYCDNDTWHDLDNTSLLLKVGDRLGARVAADNTMQIFKNGELVATYDASDFPFKFGRVGVSGLAGDQGLSWDDFGGGEWK